MTIKMIRTSGATLDELEKNTEDAINEYIAWDGNPKKFSVNYNYMGYGKAPGAYFAKRYSMMVVITFNK